jgi:Flp pilus assembly protein TadG
MPSPVITKTGDSRGDGVPESPTVSSPDFTSLRRSARGGQSGQTLPLVVAFMVILIVFVGLVVDFGNVYRVRQALRASTDAAAAAGAGQLTMSYPADASAAVTQAKLYTSSSGGRNPIPGVTPGNVNQTVTTSCVGSNSNIPCNTANTVTVNQTVAVPTYFLRLLGFNSITVSANAQACSPCNSVPLDIQLVVDRTGSMAQTGGSTNGLTKWENLQQGLLQGFLPGLDSGEDNVGLTTLPPDIHGTADVCTAAQTSNYDSNTPTYTVVPLSNTYMDSSDHLVSSSPLVSDINCMRPGGGTDYSNALEAAYAELQTDGRSGVQKIIVLLSDGAANEGQNCVTTTVHGQQVKDSDPHCMQPCHTAVNDATTYKAQGVLIYTILYGDQTGGPPCQDYTGANESPSMQPQAAMQQMASTNDYFPDPNPANLVSIFQQIASDMAAGSSRIVQ